MSDSEFLLVGSPTVDVVDMHEAGEDAEELSAIFATTPDPREPRNDPPVIKRQRAHSTQTTHSTGRASSVAAAISACSLNEPKLEANFEFEALPLDHTGVIRAKLRLDVTGCEARPKPSSVDVVICLDASLSMGRTTSPGSGAALLKQFLLDLFENGVKGKQLNLRILEFGEKVVDRQFGEAGLVRLDDTSRKQFMEIANLYEPHQSCTNLSDPVIHAVKALRDHHKAQIERGLTPLEVSHVICLTDGVANQGLTDGATCLGAARHAMGSDEILVHYIGLGGMVNAKFMTNATAAGDAGVFSVAPEASHISQAFEEVFGFALETTLPLTVELTDANGTVVSKKGMLIKERSLLLDVALNPRKEMCVANDISVRLMIGGQPLTATKQVPINYTGDVFGPVNPKVAELIASEELARQAQLITANSKSLEDAQRSINDLLNGARNAGVYSNDSLRRVQAISDDVGVHAESYRSLGASGPALYVARMQSQATSY